MFAMARARAKRVSLKAPRRIRKKRGALRMGTLSKKRASKKSFKRSYKRYAGGVDETNYLLRSPANARRLLNSIKAANAGHLQEHELAE